MLNNAIFNFEKMSFIFYFKNTFPVIFGRAVCCSSCCFIKKGKEREGKERKGRGRKGEGKDRGRKGTGRKGKEGKEREGKKQHVRACVRVCVCLFVCLSVLTMSKFISRIRTNQAS